MCKLVVVGSAMLALVVASGASAGTLQFPSMPGVDEVQIAPSLLDSSESTALSSIDDGAWRPAVVCEMPPNWVWLTDTTAPYATWISSAVLIDTTGDDSWRWFRRTIRLPTDATGLAATITWTADSAAVVYVNGTAVDSDGEVFGGYTDDEEWETIETCEVHGAPLKPGENEFLFLVRNYGPQLANPTGLIYEMSISGNRVPTNFPDVPPGHWAYDDVMACADATIVAGYPDGLYHPDETLKRSQMAVFISRALAGGDANVPSGPAEATFSDVADTGFGEGGAEPYWAYRYIEYCAAHGIVEGYWNGTYRPEQEVDRAQMAVYIARAVAGGDDAVPPGLEFNTFPDVGLTHWAYKYVEYCADQDIVQGYWDGTYHPERVVTRDQMAVYIARAFGLSP